MSADTRPEPLSNQSLGEIAPLSAQQRRIADLAAAGQTSKEIAAQLRLSPRTVDGHLHRMFRKLGVTTRAGLSAALRHYEFRTQCRPGMIFTRSEVYRASTSATLARSGKVVRRAEGSNYRQPLPMTETPSPTPNMVSLPDGAALQQLMGHLNGNPGPRVVPGRSIPVPTSVSAAMQQTIAMPYRNTEWLLNPPDAAGWNAAIAELAQQSIPQIEKIVEKLDVRVESATVAGVGVFIVTPPQIPAANANRLLVNTHGGGYLFNPGRASLLEPAVIAAACGITVIEVDYRMPPDHPFPAASDDAMAVWKAALQMAPPANIGICGGSAGGGLALSTVLRAKNEGVALPAAVAVQTPWCDLAPVGDSLKVHEWVDNVLITYDAIANRGASLYAGDHDIADPLLSPLRGDVSGFPPTMLISGTRDLLLSQVVLMHRTLRKAGVQADLHLVEGASHFSYFIDPFAPESQDIFAEMALFWDQHLGS